MVLSEADRTLSEEHNRLVAYRTLFFAQAKQIGPCFIVSLINRSIAFHPNDIFMSFSVRKLIVIFFPKCQEGNMASWSTAVWHFEVFHSVVHFVGTKVATGRSKAVLVTADWAEPPAISFGRFGTDCCCSRAAEAAASFLHLSLHCGATPHTVLPL